MMPLDPSADRARRAWLRCPNGDHGSAGCGDCAAGRSCATHWQYLLGNRGSRVYLQCPDCTQLWDVDSDGQVRLAS
jgi:positive regulator of sigma E activity